MRVPCVTSPSKTAAVTEAGAASRARWPAPPRRRNFWSIAGRRRTRSEIPKRSEGMHGRARRPQAHRRGAQGLPAGGRRGRAVGARRKRRGSGQSFSSSIRMRSAAPSRSSYCPDRSAPQERRQPGQAHEERDWYQDDQIVHVAGRTRRGRSAAVSWFPLARRLRGRPRRMALATTTMEDADMAIAATRGVTWPATATGTASTL